MAPPSRRGVLVSLLLPIYLPAGLVTTANTLLAPFLPLWLRGLAAWSKYPGPARWVPASRCLGNRAIVASMQPKPHISRPLTMYRLGASDVVVGAFFSAHPNPDPEPVE